MHTVIRSATQDNREAAGDIACGVRRIVDAQCRQQTGEIRHADLGIAHPRRPQAERDHGGFNRLGEIDEIILALSPTVEGEATARYLLDTIRKTNPTLRITRIATGVPAGSDIEYADEITMTRALENRRSL